MEGVGAAANIIAIIDLSAKLAKVTYQYSKDVRNASEDIYQLRKVITDLENVAFSVQELLSRPEGARLKASHQLLNASNESNIRLKLLYEKLRPKTSHQALSRLSLRALKWPFASKEIGKEIHELEGYRQTMSLALQVDHTTLLLDIDQKAALARLQEHVAAGAWFDSAAEQHNSRCLPNTRVELLQQISEWVVNANAKAVFWLNGMAGTGKSTISRTIAESLARQARLGASFFFKKGEADRGTMAKFFPTIAAELTRREPAIALHIKDTIGNDPSIFGRAMSEQFDKLILQPLLLIQKKEPIVVIVDALDECNEEDNIKLMIYLFSQAKTLDSVQLKVLLTSRPDLPLRLGFKAIEGKYQDLILQDIPDPVVEHDISLFLENELSRIRRDYNETVSDDRQLSKDWPGCSDITTLVQMAIPLFIYAATVCRFIGDRRFGPPNIQLKKVLQPRLGYHLSKLGSTYLPILDNLTVDASAEQHKEILQEFRYIVGSIVILASPLSTTALARMLDLPRDSIDGKLDMLHSVLSVPSSIHEPVRLLHLSFRDFLLKKTEENTFWVDEAQTHRAIASNCLRIMDCLRQDICQLGAPGIRRASVNPQKIHAHLPPELQYACLYWVYHMQRAGRHAGDSERVYEFLKCYFLHWIEALSLIGRARESLHLIKVLQSRYKGQDNEQLCEFLDDTERFILANASAIDDTPLQLYSSLLTFAPQMSKVRTTFKDQHACWILLQPQVEKYWSQTLQILEGHSAGVNSAAFSPDGSLIASASDDKTMRLWRADTGACVQTLKGHSNDVGSAAFSPDGSLIASASDDQTTRLWRADTGACVQTLKGHSNNMRSAAFSPDGSLITSASWDQTIRLWRADTGACMQTLKGHSSRVNSTAFSPDGSLIASASDDQTTRLWRADTGACVQTLKGHSSHVNSAAFSPDGSLIASASDDKTIRLWRADTGACVQTLKGHSNNVRSAAFSPDGSLIASASDDQTTRLWRADTGACVQTLKGHSSRVNSAAFSPNGSLITSASRDQTIRLWHADTGACVQTLEGLEGHSKVVNSVAFSPDGSLIASASWDQTIRLWCANTGAYIQTLKGHSDNVSSAAFSPDGSLIASASWDETVQLWRANTGAFIQTLEGHSDTVSSAVFSPDGLLIASASDDETIRLWRVNTGACIQTLKGHSSRVTSAAFSPDGLLIASASWDKTVRLWRVTGECVQILGGHGDFVESAAFSPDSSLIASASSWEGEVRLWRADTGEFVQMLDDHCSSISFDPDGKSLRTDAGVITLHESTNADLSTQLDHSIIAVSRSGVGISEDGCWVTWNGENVLWLPKEFRPSASAISGNTVVIGSDSGRVIVMKLSKYE